MPRPDSLTHPAYHRSRGGTGTNTHAVLFCNYTHAVLVPTSDSSFRAVNIVKCGSRCLSMCQSAVYRCSTANSATPRYSCSVADLPSEGSRGFALSLFRTSK